MLEDFTVAAAHDALQPSSNPTVAQIVVWRSRNPFHPKPEQLIVLIGPRIPSQLSRILLNAVTNQVPGDSPKSPVRGNVVVLNAARAPISPNAVPGTPLPLHHNRCMSNPGEAKHQLIALNLFARSQSFLKVVGEFHCRLAIRIVELAHQTYRIEVAAVLRIAVAKIIGQQRAPTRAETDAPLGNPFCLIEKVARLSKIDRRSAVADCPGKMGMQSQNRVHIEGVRSNE